MTDEKSMSLNCIFVDPSTSPNCGQEKC